MNALDTGDAASTIVVGGGSAGAVVAGLLAERSDETVLLLEAGPDYGSFDDGRWPHDLLDARDLAATHQWGFDSGDQYPNRIVPFSRARVLGGCSSHNGCAAIWGHRADYDSWAAAGNTGWSTNDLLPLLEEVSTRMRVRIPELDEVQPFQRLFLDAAQWAGIPLVDDLNDLDEPVGVAPSPANVHNGIRWNTAFAFLDPVRTRTNLKIAGNTLVDRLELSGIRVTGVHAIVGNEPYFIAADRVVLAAGVYGSPAILLRSGIGDPTQIEPLGIRTVHNLPGVGANLHDHPAIDIIYHGSQRLIDEMTAFGQSDWLPEEQVIAKTRSRSCTGAFDLHIYPAGGPYNASHSPWSCTMNVACMTPQSRGKLSLISTDPAIAPHLDHGYVSDPEGRDMEILLDGLEMTREIIAASGKANTFGPEIDPGSAISTRQQMRAWISDNVAHYYHPVGTCKMGPAGDPMAVVDPRGAVHGLEGLFVADCSIMPVIPRANTNIPAAVIGARIAGWLAEPQTESTS